MKNLQKFLEQSVSHFYQPDLNGQFWYDKKLKSIVRLHLLRIADAFIDFVELNPKAVKDVILVGGNAGYNYTSGSDLDLHIVVDTNEIPNCDPNIIEDYFKDKKHLWTLTHNITIYGTPVEPYIETIGRKRKKYQGVYSVKQNAWIQEPSVPTGEIDIESVDKKLKDYIHRIENVLQTTNDENIIIELVKKLGRYRESGLDKGGEYAVENLVYKKLRSMGYIDKLRNYVVQLKDKNLSLL